MQNKFLKILNERPILFDGATGTMLQRLGLKPGGCPDELNITNPIMIKTVHKGYMDAGSDVVTTCTFGANRTKLMEYNLENQLHEINLKAAKNAKEAAGEDKFVAGGLGPTGRFLEPVGNLSFDEAVDIFSEQVNALAQGGADLIIIETMMDIREMKAAIIAAKASGLPVVATMTFDETMRTVLGTPPEVFAIVAESLGADVIGANCSLGIEGIYKAVKAMSGVTNLPLIAQPNAGIPYLKDGKTIFPASPSEMADYVPKLLDAGVRIIGGCCGTTSEHIKEMKSEVRNKKSEIKSQKSEIKSTRLASRSGFVDFGNGRPSVIVGERINPTGKKLFQQEIKERKTSTIRKEAKSQADAGAHILDVNVGVPGIDESASMQMAVFAVNENCQLPIVLDSSSLEALEIGLKAVDGKVLINSVSGEEKKLSTILPLAKKYGAAVLGLTLDDNGIPATAEARVYIAEAILKRALECGISKSDVVIDCLAMTVSADQKSAMETLKAIRMVKEKLGLSTILGVSNISFGLPNREIINANFLTMAIEAGLDAAIINPHNNLMMDAYHAALVLTGYDLRAERYIKRYGQKLEVRSQKSEEKEEPKTIDEKLKKAIIGGDEEGIVALVEEALKQGWDPLKISNAGLIPGLEEVGRLFNKNIYFLPQVMLSADTMKRAFDRLKKEFKGKKTQSMGKVLMATVEGDIHDIGKNIVSTLLENHGFEVIDLGKNVPADKIIQEAVKNNVDVVGLSALMTTTVMEMDNVIKRLKAKGVPVLTMVGGAVVNQEFADKIGANGYAKDALEAVDKVKRLVKKEKQHA
ncbi:MAG: homocysteine S-methyltransferase family protein [Deltaproteobacteria bacterium]|nr:homocysteine S-methyltransferase family protein [Deltaproteobacteria bacterium]